jgi:hypothetical protein
VDKISAVFKPWGNLVADILVTPLNFLKNLFYFLEHFVRALSQKKWILGSLSLLLETTLFNKMNLIG